MPTYNRGEILLSTLESVRLQTFHNWECIVVDDGSTDNTRDLLTNILADSRFQYHYQENAERSAARNKGILLSKGDYICFLDSDDLYLDSHLYTLYKYITNSPDTGFFFTNSILDNSGNHELQHYPKYDHSVDYFIVNSVIPARVCIKKSVFDKFKFDTKIVIVEDTVLWTQIHFEYKVQHIEQDTIIYRWHGGNSVAIGNNSYLPRLNGLKKLFSQPTAKKKIHKRKRKAALSNCYYGIAKYYLAERSWAKMALNIAWSILLDPTSPQTKSKIYMMYEFFR